MIDRVTRSTLRAGLSALRTNPLRTALSTLGIIMGVAALVSVLALGDGMEQYARIQIERTTDLQSVVIQPALFRTIEGQRFPREDVLVFDRDDADSLGVVLSRRAVVTLMLSGQSLVRTAHDTTARVAQVIGTLETVVPALPSPVAHGRFFTKAEGRDSAAVVVISSSLATRIAGPAAAASLLGSTVSFQGEERRVVGILASTGDPDPTLAFMPVGSAEKALAPALVGRSVTLVIRAHRVEDVPELRASAEQWLAGRVGADWRDRATVVTNEGRVAQARQGMLLFKVFMGALTGISLLVGGIGIMNVLLASVAERTREIGVRRATGANRRQILLQFLSESVTISTAGSIVGVLLGLVAAFMATGIMRSLSGAQIHAGFSMASFAIAVGASVVVGLTFGLYPALRAARLSPIDAIRHE